MPPDAFVESLSRAPGAGARTAIMMNPRSHPGSGRIAACVEALKALHERVVRSGRDRDVPQCSSRAPARIHEIGKGFYTMLCARLHDQPTSCRALGANPGAAFDQPDETSSSSGENGCAPRPSAAPSGTGATAVHHLVRAWRSTDRVLPASPPNRVAELGGQIENLTGNAAGSPRSGPYGLSGCRPARGSLRSRSIEKPGCLEAFDDTSRAG